MLHTGLMGKVYEGVRKKLIRDVRREWCRPWGLGQHRRAAQEDTGQVYRADPHAYSFQHLTEAPTASARLPEARQLCKICTVRSSLDP